MATVYRLTDNSRNGLPADPDFAKSTLFSRLHGKTARELGKDERVFAFPPESSEALGSDDGDMILWGSSESLKTGNLMGFFGCDGDELVIGSRFAQADGGDWFLHRMLGKALGFSVVDLKLGIDAESRRYALLDLLFPEYFRRALLKGPYRTYVKRSFNDEHVRGVIDVPRFLRNDQPFVGKIAYNTREFTEDNDVMQLVRHAIELLCRGGSPVRSHVAALLRGDRELYALSEAVRGATPSYRSRDRAKIVAANIKSPLRSRYHRAYRDLQRLCIAMLTSRKASPLGNQGKVHGMVFDGAWLWEEYLNCLFEEAGLPVAHPRNRERKGGEYLFRSGKAVGIIFPDFIAEGPTGRVVMDAKYKHIGGVGGADYHQLLSYMFRFESDKGFFLYPESGQENPKEYKLLSGMRPNAVPREDPEVSVVKLGLPVPQDCKDEDEFTEAMARNEGIFIQAVRGALPE